MYNDSVVLITGGTGSWGYELTRQLLKSNVKKVIIYSRGELAQVTMQRYFKDPRLSFIIGDTRDYDALNHALHGVDYVFHLAALKHVPICEYQPEESIKTNIMGTNNLIKCCIQNEVKKVIDVSTDKAVSPLNVYGMCKALGEKMMIHANLLSDITRFVCIRAGNVLGSNGSVVPLFIQQIKEKNELTITHKDMTRFFLTIPEAISLLFVAAKTNVGGETFVMKMPSCKIIDLANVLIKYYGNEKTRMIETGIRPGEKMHEELVSEFEVSHTYEYNDNYYLILPTLDISGLSYYDSKINNYKKLSKPLTSLQDHLMDENEIYHLLQKGNFLE